MVRARSIYPELFFNRLWRSLMAVAMHVMDSLKLIGGREQDVTRTRMTTTSRDDCLLSIGAVVDYSVGVSICFLFFSPPFFWSLLLVLVVGPCCWSFFCPLPLYEWMCYSLVAVVVDHGTLLPHTLSLSRLFLLLPSFYYFFFFILSEFKSF